MSWYGHRQYSDEDCEEDELDAESEEDADSEQGHEYSDYESTPKKVKIRSDKDLRTKIWSKLQDLEEPCAFSFSAISPPVPIPGLFLPCHGILGLPLSTDDAKKIISEASQSPFGKGEKTCIDTSVRKSWELNPSEFSLKNPDWVKTIELFVENSCAGLGIKEGKKNISAKLHKLLLYEPGAFFKAHKDSEKVPGMFGTLIVCLPCPHKGGKLVLTHDNEKYEFETETSSDFNYSYAAWYADITHEVQQVKSGYRLIVVYNLVRQTGLEVPSYDMIRGRTQQLSSLLKEYMLRLNKKEDLPPILLHKLKHKYTQASLKLASLKPQDLALVQMLSQLSTELGFDIYLATLELVVNGDDECTDYREKEEECLKNMVTLEGKLIVKSYNCPDDALIDPKPQDARKADKEEHDGPTGNEGCPATYWYRDTVVVLVPPSKQMEFIFEFNSNGNAIEPLFNQLIKKFSKDPAQKPKLEHLCELALKQKQADPYSYCFDAGKYSKPVSPFFQQALATAIDLGRFDLFDEACKSTGNKILLEHGSTLGCWAAKNGIASVNDLLMKGIKVAASVAKMVEFVKSVNKGFKKASQEIGSVKNGNFKQWSDEAILTAVGAITKLTTDDAISLAQLCKTMDWSLFESKGKPVMLEADIMVQIAFINELLSSQKKKPSKEHQSFIEMTIRSFWNEFVFDFKHCKVVPQKSSSTDWFASRSNSADTNYLNANDILQIVKTTLSALSVQSVETTIIPAMLRAIPIASKECVMRLFIPFVQMIIKNESVGFKLATDDAIPPLMHSRLIQALLTKFLLETVGPEPKTPTDWSLPPSSCVCCDCMVINRFLQDPVRETLPLPCSKTRRTHLNEIFAGSRKDCDHSKPTYDIHIIRGSNPNVWKITKHRRGMETMKGEWMESVKVAKQTLSKLKKDEGVKGSLEAYLQPYEKIIMNAQIQELPDLMSLIETPLPPKGSENAAPNLSATQTAVKRVGSNAKKPAKKAKSVADSDC